MTRIRWETCRNCQTPDLIPAILSRANASLLQGNLSREENALCRPITHISPSLQLTILRLKSWSMAAFYVKPTSRTRYGIEWSVPVFFALLKIFMTRSFWQLNMGRVAWKIQVNSLSRKVRCTCCKINFEKSKLSSEAASLCRGMPLKRSSSVPGAKVWKVRCAMTTVVCSTPQCPL